MPDLSIVDDFSGPNTHGHKVKESAKEDFGGLIAIEEVDYVGDYGGDLLGAYRDASSNSKAVNLSFSVQSLNYDEPLVELPDPNKPSLVIDMNFESRRRFVNYGQITSVSAGNDDVFAINPFSAGVYNIAVGAVNENDEVYFFSTFHWQAVAYWAFGEDPNGNLGTSFSSPRMAAAMAYVMSDRGWSLAQALTSYEQTAKMCQFTDEEVPGGDFYGLRLDPSAIKYTNQVVTNSDKFLVDGAYRLFLGRQPDEGGSNYYQDNGGVNQLVEDANNAGDFNHDKVPVMQRVKAAYNVILHRNPGIGGFHYYLNRIKDDPDESSDLFTWQEFVNTFVNLAESNGETIYHRDAINTFLNQPDEQIGDSSINND